MWNFFNCYLSGRHEFSTWCEPGSVFLRCIHCGKRSSGWALEHKPQRQTAPVTAANVRVPSPPSSRVLPFPRVAAR